MNSLIAPSGLVVVPIAERGRDLTLLLSRPLPARLNPGAVRGLFLRHEATWLLHDRHALAVGLDLRADFVSDGLGMLQFILQMISVRA